MIKGEKLKTLFKDFFVSKNHAWIPSAPLIPEEDPSTLFISAGMHPLVPYLLGESHPSGKRLTNVQECLRTNDIEQVGDTFHHTWFEMLGNWSLGDYFKKEAIAWSLEFLTKVLKIDQDKISVTCFEGDKDAPRDAESAEIWQSLGIPKQRIFFKSKKDNWWGPVGQSGPCGPDTEMFVDAGQKACCRACRPGCSCGKHIEVWNNVFMQYNKLPSGKYEPLKQKNVDTGMGVERTLAIVNNFEDDYATDIWQPIIKTIEETSGQSYQKQENKIPMRIIADHVRAAVFCILGGITPSNKERGYVLRRLIRRSVRQGKVLGIKGNFLEKIGQSVIFNKTNYANDYPRLDNLDKNILSVIKEEEDHFLITIDRGLKEFLRLVKDNNLTGTTAFNLYQTYGFPIEMIKEEAKKEKYSLPPNFNSLFAEAKKGHQELSRKATKGFFKGGLGEQTNETIRLHTATHLLQAALRKVLGEHVTQVGSAITPEKLRFDFVHPEKVTPEETKTIEDLINQKIEEELEVKMETIEFEQAKKQGALTVLGKTYPDKVKVYSIGNFSKEVCGGPHVKNIKTLKKFKIIKEEACGTGKRRIYAILAPYLRRQAISV